MKEFDYQTSIYRSIQTTFRSRLWSKFTKAIVEYQLIKENDSIAVCISGGKDSFLLACLLKQLHEHSEVNFDLKFLIMDPGYKSEAISKTLENAKTLGLDVKVFKSDIFEILNKQEDKSSPCFLCARMRRGALYKFAESMGCNKIALGHHFDDVIETTLLSMFYNGKIQSMMPKLHSDNYSGMELIRPMFYIKEKDVKAWALKNELTFINCACPFTDLKNEYDSKRLEMKHLITTLNGLDKNIEMNIFKSMYNVNCDTAICYQIKTVNHHFLDSYDDNYYYNGTDQFKRNKLMYGENYLDNISSKKVAIFGLGGVGGEVAIRLARAGISNFYLYDFDVVDVTNINRQVVASFKTIGQDKVSVMKEMILSINPMAKVYTYKMFVKEENFKDIDFSSFDYIVDAIDCVQSKVDLIIKAKELNIPIISSMGAGNKNDLMSFKIVDLSKTMYDPLAKVMRNKLKGKVSKLKVCSSFEQVEANHNEVIPSNPFTVSICGIMIANEVFNDLRGEDDGKTSE